MSKKKESDFDQDKLVLPPADLRIVRLADVGLLARSEFSRQSSEGAGLRMRADCGRWQADQGRWPLCYRADSCGVEAIEAGVLDKGIWEPERVGEHAEWADNQEFPAWLLTIGGARGYGHVQREAALFKILKQEI